MSTQLSVFAKFWEPGKVKTRLAATIGDAKAAEVAKAFLLATLERFEQSADECSLSFAPPECRQSFAELAPDWLLQAQSPGDLGDRMAFEIRRSLSGRPKRVVLLGADSPDLPQKTVDAAFDQLQSVRLVLCPASDGGYCLVGARGRVPPILDNMPWSSESLWQATMDRLAEHGWQEGREYAVLPEWYDVDSADDLSRLRSNLDSAEEVALMALRDRLNVLFGPLKP